MAESIADVKVQAVVVFMLTLEAALVTCSTGGTLVAWSCGCAAMGMLPSCRPRPPSRVSAAGMLSLCGLAAAAQWVATVRRSPYIDSRSTVAWTSGSRVLNCYDLYRRAVFWNCFRDNVVMWIATAAGQ